MNQYLPEGLRIHTDENTQAVKSYESLQDALHRQTILEARAMLCDCDHNLIVDLGCMKGMIPRLECAAGIESGEMKDIAIISRVNKPVCFVVTDFQQNDRGETMAVLSRRRVQEACSSFYIQKLVNGDVIPARVTHLEKFGAFVDIGCGIVSLMPIDAISVSRISHPRDRFTVGMDIKALVKTRDENGRIVLSHKELLGTWEENAALFTQGETVAGLVRSVEDYGVFVELSPNLAGLAEPKENVYVGQQASVYIKSIIPEKMKVKLIIVDTFDSPYIPKPPVYFYEGCHLSYFKYSPQSSAKCIDTFF